MSLKTLCILNHKETYFGVSFGMFHLAIFPCFHALKKCNPNTEEETKNHVSIFNFFTPLVFFAFWKHFMQVFPLQTELLLSICILQFWHFPLLSLVTTSVERHQKLLFFGNCSFMTRGSKRKVINPTSSIMSCYPVVKLKVIKLNYLVQYSNKICCGIQEVLILAPDSCLHQLIWLSCLLSRSSPYSTEKALELSLQNYMK